MTEGKKLEREREREREREANRSFPDGATWAGTSPEHRQGRDTDGRTDGGEATIGRRPTRDSGSSPVDHMARGDHQTLRVSPPEARVS
jgi:hypothetical protein